MTAHKNINTRDPQAAFGNAIEMGQLFTNKYLERFAGNYMYMHTESGMDYFKNKNTRKYIQVAIRQGQRPCAN